MNSDNSAHQAVRFQDAQAMYYQRPFGQRRDVAVIAEILAGLFVAGCNLRTASHACSSVYRKV